MAHPLAQLLVILGVPQSGGSSCGVTIPRAPGAPSALLEPLRVGEPDDLDLEDMLFSDPEPRDWENILRRCSQGGESCRTFGIEEWNLTSFNVLRHQGVTGKPCAEDFAVVQRMCGGPVACREIDGKRRVVGFSGEGRPDLNALSQLPHLFALELHGPRREDLQGQWPQSLRVLRLVAPHTGALTLAPTLRSLQIHGRQDNLRWTKIDFAALCGLNLTYFVAFAIEVAGGTLPDCWAGMKHLRNFYCSNCMMRLPPTALRGLHSLRSFVAFRQWEMIPCALRHVANASACKASWETQHETKGHWSGDAANSDWGDFQEGPSFLCPEFSFSFPFEEFLKLDWPNIQKVWLDGNFLTGRIPENIGDLWPKLESLDLYDNNLEGPVPASLGSLPFLKLQLHGNRLEGRVPEPVMRLLDREHIQLGLQENPLLEGCAPQVGHWTNGIPGTRVRPCDEL
ncbi:unnamed protein product [Effrenium voratum]|uniref:Uncharacterized protein n=1 Tax=Effrenium voratum TaxID=2562239 RepID=A0AA36NEA3_9DINO|nr:unnamed protein product [Effrenium voratum]CAJ1409355.1 unnamed protein product [Effrenium voratum]CAJ1447951.1 unnamed protein product [Effrenium voratum]